MIFEKLKKLILVIESCRLRYFFSGKIRIDQKAFDKFYPSLRYKRFRVDAELLFNQPRKMIGGIPEPFGKRVDSQRFISIDTDKFRDFLSVWVFVFSFNFSF